ncbi:carbohydrate ABC transporter permease [Kitasatospora misakiensis]|uniref:Carbohydrate ABC transporter permease n=1 Tax=Kitasatospora misakiensis TaxID=67330 RepID=A0ABW0X6C2_9ACTN
MHPQHSGAARQPSRNPSSARTAAKSPQRARARTTALAFIAPFGLLFIAFYLVPIGYAIDRSFYQIHREGAFGQASEVFAGLANYTAALSDADFLHSVGRVLLFGIVQVPLMLALALLIALLLDSGVLRLKRFFRIAVFLPYAVPAVIGAIVWGYLYSPGLSPVLGALSRLGLSPDLLGPDWILWSIANIVTWTYTGYNVIILYSALRAIDPALYEAARMDGATGWQVAWHIKVPILRPALALTTLFSIIGTLQLFTEPEVLHGISSSVSSSFTPTIMAFNQASGNNYSYAATLSVILALTTAILSYVLMKTTQRRTNA